MKRRHEYERQRDLSLAWTIVALDRQKTLPSLQELFAKSGVSTHRRQTVAQQRATLVLISEAIGIPIRPAGDKRPVIIRPKDAARRKERRRG